jgi:hypothetical protein
MAGTCSSAPKECCSSSSMTSTFECRCRRAMKRQGRGHRGGPGSGALYIRTMSHLSTADPPTTSFGLLPQHATTMAVSDEGPPAYFMATSFPLPTCSPSGLDPPRGARLHPNHQLRRGCSPRLLQQARLPTLPVGPVR